MAAEPRFVGYRPGIIAEITKLHATYYASVWGFGASFEAKVARELGMFVAEHDPSADLFLNAVDRQPLLGSITIDRTVTGGEGAHLRWFIVADAARGSGLGRRLMERAMAFCKARGYTPVWLTTFAGLDPARRLYERFGFTLVHEAVEDQWQAGVREQRFERVATAG